MVRVAVWLVATHCWYVWAFSDGSLVGGGRGVRNTSPAFAPGCFVVYPLTCFSE